MSHDGNFESLDVGREFCVGWRTVCNDSGPHNGVGPGSVGNAQSGKVSSIVLMFISVDASPWCSIGITSNHVKLSTNHDGADCQDDFFFFLQHPVFLA